MAIPEPTGPLWAAVKAIYDPWPLDAEESATDLARAWRQGGTAMGAAAQRMTLAGAAAHVAWGDVAGAAFDVAVRARAGAIGALAPRMELAAGRSETYASELVGAKTDIVTTIAANSATYVLLGNPLLGPVGPALQLRFAMATATALQGMIEARAATLRAGTVTPAPPPEPVPPPGPAPEPEESNFWSDLGHTALDIVGLVPVVGEVADGINAAWYAAEGDWLNASLSLAAMVPIAGWVATGGKLGYRAFNTGLRFQPVTSLTAAISFAKNRPPGVPLRAEALPFRANSRFPNGEKWQWTEPGVGTVTQHGHGLDTKWVEKNFRNGGNVDGVGNSGAGPVNRQRVDQGGPNDGYKDVNKQYYDLNTVRSNDAVANATHVPASKSYPSPDETHTRVFVPNVAALGPNDVTPEGAP